MKIKEIISQYRRDFTAIYQCKNCGHEYKDGGYDDAYFHQTVVPNIICPKCGKKADENYKPRNTKYREWEIV